MELFGTLESARLEDIRENGHFLYGTIFLPQKMQNSILNNKLLMDYSQKKYQ